MAIKILSVTISLAIHVALAAIFLSWTDKSPKEPIKVAMTLVGKPKNDGAPTTNLEPQKPLQPKTIAKKGKNVAPCDVESNILGDGQATNDATKDIGFGVMQRHSPVLLNKGESIPYPEKAKLLLVEGSVFLRLTVAKDGHVAKAEVISGHFDLRKAALKLADKLLFLPATDEDGMALVSMVEHEVVFRLIENS